MQRKCVLAGLVAGALALAGCADDAARAPNGVPVAYGRPSFEGTWKSNYILVPEATAKTPNLVVSETEAKAIAADVAARMVRQAEGGLDPELGDLALRTDGLPLVRGQRRTRLLIQPADGKFPYTPEARKEMSGQPKLKFDNPEDLQLSEQCLVGLGQAPLTSLNFYTRLQMVQTPDHLVIRSEAGDDLRIIPFTRQHAPMPHKFLGDSIAWWEGDTLVIETTGLPDATRRRIFPFILVPGGDSKVIERLTRVSDKELVYQFTVIDPKAYAAPWLAEFSWYLTDEPMFEWACHEANYGLRGILSAARHAEAVAREKAAAQPVAAAGN